MTTEIITSSPQVFNIHSYITIDKLDLKSDGTKILLSEIGSKNAYIQILGCLISADIDTSLDNVNNLIITDSTLTTDKIITYNNTKSIEILGTTILASDINEVGTDIMVINNSDVFKIEIDFNYVMDWNVDASINGITLNKSYVKDMDITFKTEYYGMNPKWLEVTAGHEAVMALRDDGTIWGAGWGFYGEMGLGQYYHDNPNDILVLTQEARGDTDWKHVTQTTHRSYAIKEDGTLWTSPNGSYEFSQYGIEDDWDQLSGGWEHSLALKTDGTVWGVGDNYYGQLAIPYASAGGFTKIIDTTDNIKVVAGGHHSLVLKSDGTILGTGLNTDGQLGVGDFVDRNEFTPEDNGYVCQDMSAGDFHSCIITTDGKLYTSGPGADAGSLSTTFQTFQQELNGFTDWVSVESDCITGGWRTSAIRSDGSLWGCGGNGDGQLGLGRDDFGTYNWFYVFTQVGTDTDWVRVTHGTETGHAIKEDGTLWSTGSNTWGQLGTGDGINKSEYTITITTEV